MCLKCGNLPGSEYLITPPLAFYAVKKLVDNKIVISISRSRGLGVINYKAVLVIVSELAVWGRTVKEERNESLLWMLMMKFKLSTTLVTSWTTAVYS